jgi:hypothetical protein
LKIKIANGTPVECYSIEINGPVVTAWSKPEGKRIKIAQRLIFAYHLHPGETVRVSEQAMAVDGEVLYEINL